MKSWTRSMIPALSLFFCLAASALAQESPHGPLTIACDRCHSTATWKVATLPRGFSHATTGFPLEGQHAAVQCRQCHTTLTFSKTSDQCAECHSDIHRGELGTACDRCHSPESWLVPDMAQRHSPTRFALTGAHLNAVCEKCHPNQQKHQYVGTPTECNGCHMGDYQATLAPAHAQAGLGTNCVECHAVTAMSWGANFDHARTGFPLTGAHLAVRCNSCHPGGKFTGTSQDCYSCHRSNYTSAANPVHSGGALPTLCEACHSTAGWRPASFDHGRTSFPLTGAHLAVPCASCHPNGRFTGTPQDCYSCHQSNFANASNPVHSGGAFPTQCETCHNTSDWRPASFDHGRTSFPLTGAHLAVPCVSCHANGRFTGTPQDCYSCHQSNYAGATNPVHTPGSFPTLCENCHSTTAWRPASLQHDGFFPISAGTSHSPGRWSACSDCHTVPTDYKVFSCITCHAHDKSLVDPKHSGVSRYTYDSQACYNCHPRGRGG